MTHTALTVRALVIGEALAVQVVAMREQRIGARSLNARVAQDLADTHDRIHAETGLHLTVDQYRRIVQTTERVI